MRTSIAVFSVSVVTLIFANDPVKAQCASGWGWPIPDGRHSPCFEVHVDTNVQETGSLPQSHDELITRVTPEKDEFIFKGSTLSLFGTVNSDGTVNGGAFGGHSQSATGFFLPDGTINLDPPTLQPAPEVTNRPLVRDLFLRSTEHWKTVWPVGGFK